MHTEDIRKRVTGFILALLVVVICCTPQFRSLFSMPANLEISQGNLHHLKLSLPLSIQVRTQDGYLKVNGEAISQQGINLKTPFTLEPVDTGQVQVEFRLFGIIPLKKMVVNVVPKMELIPGGQSVGVTLRTRGVLVVGYAKISTDDQLISPAKDVGIEVGDHILEVNNKLIKDADQFELLINSIGKRKEELTMIIERQGQILTVITNPVLCDHTGYYRLGMYVKDNASGVGTLTFIDQETRVFGALGHIVTDVDTNQPFVVDDGDIVKAEVTSIEQGKPGAPGQKHSISVDSGNILGKVYKNTAFGIFGEMVGVNFNELQPLPVALMDQVKEGPAEIWTVVEGQKVEKFSAQVVKANRQYSPTGKGMVIEINDSRLLNQTGGIVQGMSGSPIIQNGRLIGAVTHVFLNNPARGYACYIEFMILESGLIDIRQRHVPTLLWPLRRTG